MTYGITWHRIGSKIDAGDILKQATFDLQPARPRSRSHKCFATPSRRSPTVSDLSSETAVAKAARRSRAKLFGRPRLEAA